MNSETIEINDSLKLLADELKILKEKGVKIIFSKTAYPKTIGGFTNSICESIKPRELPLINIIQTDTIEIVNEKIKEAKNILKEIDDFENNNIIYKLKKLFENE